jgi:hypothetical protein
MRELILLGETCFFRRAAHAAMSPDLRSLSGCGKFTAKQRFEPQAINIKQKLAQNLFPQN